MLQKFKQVKQFVRNILFFVLPSSFYQAITNLIVRWQTLQMLPAWNLELEVFPPAHFLSFSLISLNKVCRSDWIFDRILRDEKIVASQGEVNKVLNQQSHLEFITTLRS